MHTNPARTWYITVKVTADDDSFRDGVDADDLLAAIRDEIVSNLEDCGATVEIVAVRDDFTP